MSIEVEKRQGNRSDNDKIMFGRRHTPKSDDSVSDSGQKIPPIFVVLAFFMRVLVYVASCFLCNRFVCVTWRG